MHGADLGVVVIVADGYSGPEANMAGQDRKSVMQGQCAGHMSPAAPCKAGAHCKIDNSPGCRILMEMAYCIAEFPSVN